MFQGSPYWTHRQAYYIYWSDDETDNLDLGESRWYLDGDTDTGGYYAHSMSTMFPGDDPTSSTLRWREVDMTGEKDTDGKWPWSDAAYSIALTASGDLIVQPPLTSSRHARAAGTYCRLPETMNGKAIWLHDDSQKSIYRDDGWWRVNYQKQSDEASLHDRLVSDADDNTQALGTRSDNEQYPPLGAHEWKVHCVKGEKSVAREITVDAGGTLLLLDASSGH